MACLLKYNDTSCKTKKDCFITKKHFDRMWYWCICSNHYLVISMAFPGSTITSDNSILVDPTKEKQTLFVLARVTIQNTGNQPLTNITVDYGYGDRDFIPILKPGETLIMSPPEGNSLQFVRVTADGNIDVYKAYREPIAMPGMMGS